MTGAWLGKPGSQGSSYRPIFLLCPAVKFLDSYADDHTIFVCSSRFDDADADLAGLLRGVSDWSASKKLAVAPGKSSVTFFTTDPHQSRSPPFRHYLQRQYPSR